MSLVASFSVSQNVSNPSVLVVNDTSSGSDASVVTRRLFLQKSDGTYLVPQGTPTSYIPFPQTTLSVSVLDRDYALSVTVQWLDASNSVLYSVTSLIAFTLYGEVFHYGLTQLQTSNPAIINDSMYYGNKLKVRMGLDEATNAVTFGGDILAAQAALGRVQELITNQSIYF